MNRNYGRLTDGVLKYAPDTIHAGDTWNVCPNAAAYLAAGWLPVVDSRPTEPAPEGKHWEAQGWAEDGGSIVRQYALVDDPPVYRTYSKLKLYAALVSAGLWEGVKTWLEAQEVGGMNAYTAFSLAQDLTDSNEMFASYLAQLKEALGVSDEVVEQILAASVA